MVGVVAKAPVSGTGVMFSGRRQIFCCWGWKSLMQVTLKRQMRPLFWRCWRVQSYHPLFSQKAARCSFETGRTESVKSAKQEGLMCYAKGKA